MAGIFRFVQPTLNITDQFFGGFDSAIHDHAPKWPDTTCGDIVYFNSLKSLINLLPAGNISF